MATSKIIIIGAGPKAMAIAAKNFVLRDLGLPAPDIQIIEKNSVAAHWTGEGGYTNGRLALGTAPEKDVGFPYLTHGFGTALDNQINDRMREFSWASYLISIHEYSDWVDRGRTAPQHRQWASYLKWVYDKVKSTLTCTRGEVTQISLEGEQWRVRFLRHNEGIREVMGDGIVVTGPGATRLPIALPVSDRVLTVETFWATYESFRRASQAKILLVGAGENSAAIAMSIALLGNDSLKVDILAPRGMVYSRGESFQENRVYSDAARGNWEELTETDRRRFISQTDRGVFSQYAQRVLDGADIVRIVPGRLSGLKVSGNGGVEVTRVYNESVRRSEYDYIVVATGSDPLQFLTDKMDKQTCDEVVRRSEMRSFAMEAVEYRIDSSLAISGLTPRLHLPMLSGLTQGPGFANLSCLGRLSDRILAPYTVAGSVAVPIRFPVRQRYFV